MNDFQKWSVLAFRAMDDAGRVLMTIEPESTTEGERLDQLKATIRELLTQCMLLNGLCTRRQLDERFGFGKLDTDALNVQLGLKQQAEPVAWGVDWGHNGDISCVSTIKKHHDGKIEVIATEYDPKASTPPKRQWVGLTDEDYLNALDLHPYDGTDREFWNVLEAKLKEKNT